MAIGSKISELKEKASKKLSSAKELARAKLPMGKSEIKEITKKAEEIASAINKISNRLNQNKNVVARLRKRFENEIIIHKYLKSDAGKSKVGITTEFLKNFNELLNDFIEKLGEYQDLRDKLGKENIKELSKVAEYISFKNYVASIKKGMKINNDIYFGSCISILSKYDKNFEELNKNRLDALKYKQWLYGSCVKEVKELKKYKNKIVKPTICYDSVTDSIDKFVKTLRKFFVEVVN